MAAIFIANLGGRNIMGKSIKGKELGNAIYQRPNGTYEARYIDRFGKQRSVYAKTLTEVGKKQRQKIYENEKQINIVDEKMTLDEWYEKWISVCKKHCRSKKKIKNMNELQENIRDKQIHIYVSQSELNLFRFRSKMAGMTVSEYCRRIINENKIIMIPGCKDLFGEIVLELRKIQKLVNKKR